MLDYRLHLLRLAAEDRLHAAAERRRQRRGDERIFHLGAPRNDRPEARR